MIFIFYAQSIWFLFWFDLFILFFRCISEKHLCDKGGSISKAQLSRYENQSIQPPADILNKIAMILNTSVDYLINGNTDEKAKATLKNADLLKQFREEEELPEDEQKVVVKFIGAYLRDYKTKKAYAS